MYSYEYDEETGGLLLNVTPCKMSKEPRPVYYKELDILGFDRFWNYEKDDSAPYMWAEANNYFYRGRKVASTKGGSLYTAPELVILEEPEPEGAPLRFVDVPAMVEKNRGLLEPLVQETIRSVYNTYVEYRKKVDVFYVAFSGGKDSVVTLDIVQRALPHNDFLTLFGDTGMEFPDTYSTVEKVQSFCETNGISFIRSKSELEPSCSWRQFGPPATVNRWCCSVHKTAPQILTLRKYLGKANFTGMAFIGVRASESVARSEYDYVSLGEKHRGQYSCNPILSWNSAELYLYIYAENLILNETYKKGNRRAGCLICPRAAERNDWMSRVWYTNEVDSFLTIIRDLYTESYQKPETLDDFIANGGWKARKNGRDISIGVNYSESVVNGKPTIKIVRPRTDWKEWIKTIGVLRNNESPYIISYKNEQFLFEVEETADGLSISYDGELAKTRPVFIKLLKNVFRKAACCITCHECEADCHNGCIHMENGQVTISDKCIHCAQCHKAEKGCLLYKSLEMPKGGSTMAGTKSLNSYSHHAPKMEWIQQFFTYKNDFDSNHSLGSQMYNFFKRFLRDAELTEGGVLSPFAEKISQLSLDDNRAWALMLTNLAYSSQVGWFIKNLTINVAFTKEYTLSLLVADGAKESWVGDVWSSLGRFTDLPFGTVGLGVQFKENNKFVSVTRMPWQNPDATVILYSLYKFAEKCGDYYQFTLSRLLDHEAESDGVSPTEIFGLDRETMEKLLRGLSINYPDFITADFQLGLDTITLNSGKSSADVLELI